MKMYRNFQRSWKRSHPARALAIWRANGPEFTAFATLAVLQGHLGVGPELEFGGHLMQFIA